MRRIASLLMGFAAGVAIIGLGGSALLTLVLGDVSSDAGSRWMTFVYALLACAVLTVIGGASFAAVLLPLPDRLLDVPRRWLLYGGAAVGGAAAMAMAVGPLQRVARLVAPVGGRGAWILACAIAGVAAGLLVAAVLGVGKNAVAARR